MQLARLEADNRNFNGIISLPAGIVDPQGLSIVRLPRFYRLSITSYTVVAPYPMAASS